MPRSRNSIQTLDQSLSFMDLEIQFGEVEESEPEVQLRPDQNKHFAVVSVYEPEEPDLPVFVDLDTLRDMEEHAVSNTNVELGGVMLGGQYLDPQGRPFVLVSDSLRAQHFEATKGSFKFTHDTWEQITRERDEFPDELQMIGWYHTHPDWGVFLSGMDMFICDHFFNKKLDLALVIDPCRQDRGFFQWTGDSEQRVRRTGGFYLVSSRFRQYELQEFATYLEGRFDMSADPRFRGGYGAPVVHVDGTQANWQTVAVLGMLAMQFCFLMLIAWRLMLGSDDPASTDGPQQAAVEHDTQARLAQAIQHEAIADAKTRALDAIVSRWNGTPQNLISSLAEQKSQVEQLQGNVRAQQALERQLRAEMRTTQMKLTVAEEQRQLMAGKIESLETANKKLKGANKQQKQQALGKDQEALTPWNWNSLPWGWIAIGAGLGALAGGGMVASIIKQKNDESAFEHAEDFPSEANKELASSQNRHPSQE